MQFYTRKRKVPAINIVSLIDILCLLLIFFIVTTTFKKEEPEIQIDVPESSQAKKGEEKTQPVIVYVTKKEEIFIANKPVTLEALGPSLSALEKEGPGRLFALKVDKGAPVGLFVKILDAAKEAGIRNFSLFADETPKQP
jgi:biopolymer transport protein ExbD